MTIIPAKLCCCQSSLISAIARKNGARGIRLKDIIPSLILPTEALGVRMEATIAANQQITVLVVSDVRLYREGLAAMLSSAAGLFVVASAVDCLSTLDHLRTHRPDVVLIDTATRNTLEIFRAVRQEAVGDTKVVAFGVPEQEIIRYAEAGAAGYVPRNASFDELLAVIGSVWREELLCPPRVASMLFRRLAERAETGHDSLRKGTLTAREREVLNLIRRGLSNKEIAQALNISEATAKNHVHHLLDKLNVTSRTQAAGWVPALRGWPIMDVG